MPYAVGGKEELKLPMKVIVKKPVILWTRNNEEIAYVGSISR